MSPGRGKPACSHITTRRWRLSGTLFQSTACFTTNEYALRSASGQMARHRVPARPFLQLRRTLRAARLRDRTAGMEVAARRRLHRARHVALEADAVALELGIRHRHRGEQRLGVGMLRVAVEVARLRQL